MAPPHGSVNMSQGVSNTGGPADVRPGEEQPTFADSSGPLFNMYREIAEGEDKKMAKGWQKDAGGILIFTGLFSAAVAVLVAVTVLELKPNPQDTSAFYLENIYQLLADPNITRSSIPVTPLRPPPFSPPKYVIWVNSLWFLSLTISLACAMLATLTQQWARRYLRIADRPRDSPHDAARIRAFFAHGIEKFLFSWVVEAIPTLIHTSLFLFFAGLLIYLFNINHTVFRAVVWWVAVTGATYLLITIMPIFWRDAPYYSPLSSLALLARSVILFPYFIRLFWSRLEYTDWKAVLRHFFSTNLEKVVEISARESSPEMDGHILKWTFGALTQDHDLDRFINCILGFYRSNVVEDPRRSLARLRSWKFSSALVAYLGRTWTLNDNSVPESDKIGRIVTCMEVAEATLHVAGNAVYLILRMDWRGQLSVEVGHSLRNRENRTEQEIGLLPQAIIALIIADVQGSNDRWITLAADQLGKSEDVIRGYLVHGNGYDNVLLANLIHIIHQILFLSSVLSRDMAQDMARMVTLCLPQPLYSFEIGATLLGLQHAFCAVWDETVREARNRGDTRIPVYILNKVRRLYVELHPGTDDTLNPFDVSSYPFCNNRHGHTPDPILATPLLPINPAHTSLHPSDASEPGDAPQLAIAFVSQASHTIPATSQHIAGASAAPLHESTTPPSMVPASLSSGSLIPVPSSALTGDLHSPVDSSINQSDRPPHILASPSSSPTTDLSRIAPQVTSFPDPRVTASITVLGMHDDIQDANVPTLGGEEHDPSENLA